MPKLWPFPNLGIFKRRRPLFEAAVLDEIDYLTSAFGKDAPRRGLERASRDHISSRRREVIAEAVRRINRLGDAKATKADS